MKIFLKILVAMAIGRVLLWKLNSIWCKTIGVMKKNLICVDCSDTGQHFMYETFFCITCTSRDTSD